MATRTLLLPLGGGVIGQDDVPLVRIMDSDETPTTITVYGVVDTVRPVESVTWTVNGVSQAGDVTKSPVLELTDLQPETSYAITLRATNMNGESQASTRTIWTKKVTTITPSDVLDGITYYDYQDVFQTGTIPSKDETDIVVSGRDVTVPAGYYDENETVSVSSDYIIPTGSVSITGNGPIDVTQYAGADVNVQPDLEHLNVTPSTSQQTFSPTGADGYDQVVVGPVGANIDQNITAGNIKKDVTILGVTGDYDPTPVLTPLSVTPSTSSQTITPTGGADGFDEVNVSPVTSSIDANITAGNIKKDVNILGVTGTFEGGITPTGTLNIVNNGTYDITNYANVNVNVAAGDFNELCFTANEANCTVSMWQGVTNRTIYYSTDNKATWTLWDYSAITLANINDKVYFYGYNPTEFTASGEYNSSSYKGFVTTGNLKVSGNIMTLISRYGDRENAVGSNTFYRLFIGTTITDASDLVLPATTLSTKCYSQMFYGCGNLVNGPATLPSLNLAEYCYYGMFQNCSSLTTAPTLPATTLFSSCYSNMFQGCSSLQQAPALQATTLAQSCYSNMFKGCSSLTTAPELPATTLVNYCYQNMFNGCTSLVTAPELPATTLFNECYSNMFRDCSSLTTAPELPATVLASNCYVHMFNGCTNLNNIIVNAQTWSTGSASNWVNNVAASGTFIKPLSLTIGTGTGQIPADSVNGIPTGWTVAEMPSVTDDNEYVTINVPAGQTVYYTTDGTTPTTASTQYTAPIDATSIGNAFTVKCISTDGNNYISPVISYEFIYMFYIEALENNTVLNVSNWKSQYSFQPIKVQYSTDKSSWNNIVYNMSSYTLTNTGDKVYFRRATAAISTDTGNVWGQGSLNAVTSGTIKVGGSLEYACYWEITGNRGANTGCENMFQNCTGLVDASKLKLFGSYYKNMFNGCTSLTSAPALPATTLTDNCYYFMFNGCTSLTTAPALPATTLSVSCYDSMFKGCTNLTSAPALTATTLANFCYKDMFNNCNSLTTAPTLPATIMALGCYQTMFGYCTSLTTAPTLPATTLAKQCYFDMFRGCSSLQQAPALTATTLSEQCYRGMFNGCTSLTTAPELPAITLTNSCYDGMFDGCSSLNAITCMATDISATNCTRNWVSGVAANGTFIKTCYMTSWTTGVSGIPSGWTVLDNDVCTVDCTNYSDMGYASYEDCDCNENGNSNGYHYVIHNYTSGCNGWTVTYDGSQDCDAINHQQAGLWFEWELSYSPPTTYQQYVDTMSSYGITVNGSYCQNAHYSVWLEAVQD